ncbi:TIGR00730 family Rossman fold protein [Gammaproteobacteria bacterium]|nr:TIGR00730 family Rossman fold protein [Gammaproteobacteria bacterium]MDB4252835.1 TIGR00730 family Rossman fold protein [Gammaproteobacteria bacterium]MDB9996994.1 TIGR00730 family Rossman fold protein [Gammaproteobacteria bacterium]MDC1191061.1 TIGR00730 family Rossman fold protein [Gammaproteobacteria bacterium]
MKIQNISIFCGAHEGNNPIYAEEAKNIAEVIAKKGINVVFGGGNVGLMKVISNTALDNGVDALGISLKSLYELELVNPRLKEVIVAETLLDRKDVFMDRSDAFIVLPGGVGSLDELAEVMASNQLGIINKPIGILNTAGYYDHLIAWMKKGVSEGFISDANFNELIITDSCEELVERIINEQRPADNDWTNRLGLD